MLLKADFNSQIGAVRPNVQVLNSVCRKLIDNKSLKSFLRFVLHAGNFINKVSLNLAVCIWSCTCENMHREQSTLY